MSNRIASMLGEPNTYKVTLVDVLQQKLMKKKLTEKEAWLKESSHEEYLNYLVREQLGEVKLMDDWSIAIRRETVSALAPIWAENFAMNLALGHMIDGRAWLANLDEQVLRESAQILAEKRNPTLPEDLKEMCSISRLPKQTGKPALVVAAGPSIHEHNHIKMLADKGWKGPVLTTDRMLKPLLDAGVCPANGFDLYVATVDGHRILIPRMFRDAEGKPLKAEGVKGMMVSTAAPQAFIAAREAGIETRWFHGMMDDFSNEDGVSSWQNWMIGAPAISAGGNVGATCWTLAMYLRCNPIVFIGLDLGYTPDTKIEQTAYYEGFKASGATDSQIVGLMQYGINPDFDCRYMQDPIFKQYREGLLEMIRYREEVECALQKGAPGIYPIDTWNCTEGGSFHGTHVKGKRFSEVLNIYGK